MNNKDNCDILYKIEFNPARMCLDSNPNSARVPIPCIIISLKTSDNSEKSISAYDLGFSSVSPKNSEGKIEQVNKLDFNWSSFSWKYTPFYSLGAFTTNLEKGGKINAFTTDSNRFVVVNGEYQEVLVLNYDRNVSIDKMILVSDSCGSNYKVMSEY